MVHNLDEQKPLDLSVPDLQNAVRLLVAHEHALCRGDEDAADDLLADLEPLLRRLNWAQNEWLRGLSGDLHMLNNEETFIENPYPYQEYEALLAENWNGIQDNPNELLRLLRFKQSDLPSARTAYARGRAYSILGFPNVATVFTRRASMLSPQQPIQGEIVIPIVEEALVVGKRQVQSSGSHIHTYVIDGFVEDNITLHEEHMTVDRRAVTDADMAFGEKSFEVTETSEEAVVGKTATERTETVRDMVRRTNIDVRELASDETTRIEY